VTVTVLEPSTGVIKSSGRFVASGASGVDV
jgi:hypothetical protein